MPRARKGVSPLLRESRAFAPRALTRTRTRIALASRLPGTCIASARAKQGKARQLSVDDKYGFTERPSRLSVLNFARSNIRSRFRRRHRYTRTPVNSTGPMTSYWNTQDIAFSRPSRSLYLSRICVIKSARLVPKIWRVLSFERLMVFSGLFDFGAADWCCFAP